MRRENLLKIAQLEKQAHGNLDGEVVCGPDDKTFLEGKLGANDGVWVLPNGYDPDFFHPEGAAEAKAKTPTAMFCGALDYTPNVDGLLWYLEEIHDKIVAQVPEFSFLIVGKSPTPAIVEAAQRPACKLVGEVPDVRPYYRESWVQWVPLRINWRRNTFKNHRVHGHGHAGCLHYLWGRRD